jgi:hypothetical protein
VADGPKCPKCNDRKWSYEVQGDDVIPVPCVCLQREKLRRFIGNQDIWRAKHIKSELLTDEIDATTENLFIHGTWDMMCQHLRWVLSAKYLYFPGFSFRLTDDNHLIRIWLGEFAYKNRQQSAREDKTVWNGLDDFLEDPSLVVIKLGAVKRNKAAGDVLETALRIRARVSKPTWIVEDFIPYGPGHESYTESVFGYIHERFTIENVGGDVEAARAKSEDLDRALQELVSGHGVTMDKDERHVADLSADVSPPGTSDDDYERPDYSDADDDILPPSGENKSSRKKKWRR